MFVFLTGGGRSGGGEKCYQWAGLGQPLQRVWKGDGKAQLCGSSETAGNRQLPVSRCLWNVYKTKKTSKHINKLFFTSVAWNSWLLRAFFFFFQERVTNSVLCSSRYVIYFFIHNDANRCLSVQHILKYTPRLVAVGLDMIWWNDKNKYRYAKRSFHLRGRLFVTRRHFSWSELVLMWPKHTQGFCK